MSAIGTRTALIALAATLALGITACGGASSGEAPAVYVKSVCGAAMTWKNAIQSAGSRLQVTSSTRSLPNTKASYVAFVRALLAATANARHQLMAAGAPSVSDGKKISASLVGIFTEAESRLQRATNDAASLPTSSPASFNAAATSVENEIRGSLAGMANATPEKNPQLHAAAARDPTCRSLASSGG